MCQGAGSAIAKWATNPAFVRLSGTTTGAGGAGNVTGSLLVPPAPGLYMAAFSAAGVVGQQAASFASVYSTGIAAALTGATYSGASVGVGVGADISKVSSALPAPLEALLLAEWWSVYGGSGPKANLLAKALANGIAAQTLLGTGVGVVTAPAAGPLATVGTSPQSWVI